MPTVELDIRQLADEGGTAPIAPITVTDAVLDENGDTLTDTLDEIKSGLIPLEGIDVSKANIKNRVSAEVVSLNFFDSTNSGLAIDFNFGNGTITVYKVTNGTTVSNKKVNIT